MQNTLPNFVFFGTSQFSVELLDALSASGVLPSYIVTTPDMPKGRKLILTPSPVKVWATEKNIPCFQPASLKDESVITKLKNEAVSNPLFVVASYGKIIPESILSLPKNGCVNIHPSLLPHYRGPSPIQSQIIANEQNIGTSIMLMDKEVDHGALLGQKEIVFLRNEGELTEDYTTIEKKLAIESAQLFIESVSGYVNREVTEKEQDHNKATFTKMIEKADGEIDLTKPASENYRKYLAYSFWPGTFFFDNGKRLLIKKASYKNDTFVIERVVPEGKKEMPYSDYLQGTRNI